LNLPRFSRANQRTNPNRGNPAFSSIPSGSRGAGAATTTGPEIVRVSCLTKKRDARGEKKGEKNRGKKARSRIYKTFGDQAPAIFLTGGIRFFGPWGGDPWGEGGGPTFTAAGDKRVCPRGGKGGQGPRHTNFRGTGKTKKIQGGVGGGARVGRIKKKRLKVTARGKSNKPTPGTWFGRSPRPKKRPKT